MRILTFIRFKYIELLDKTNKTLQNKLRGMERRVANAKKKYDDLWAKVILEQLLEPENKPIKPRPIANELETVYL